MEALLTIIGTTAVLVVFAALSVVFGSDSRDDFSERTLRPTYH